MITMAKKTKPEDEVDVTKIEPIEKIKTPIKRLVDKYPSLFDELEDNIEDTED